MLPNLFSYLSLSYSVHITVTGCSNQSLFAFFVYSLIPSIAAATQSLMLAYLLPSSFLVT